MADLRWLGIDWDAGPDREDERGPYRQSQRGALYAQDFAALERAGCGLSVLLHAARAVVVAPRTARRRQAAALRGHLPRAVGRRARTAAERRACPPRCAFACRAGERIEFVDFVHGPQSFLTDDIGDFVVRRADGTAAFFFSNAVDDARMGVTQVLRGEDHLTNTPRQLLMLAALGSGGPGLRARRPDRRRRRCAAVQASRGGERARVPRARLPAGGVDQSSVPARALDATAWAAHPR